MYKCSGLSVCVSTSFPIANPRNGRPSTQPNHPSAAVAAAAAAVSSDFYKWFVDGSYSFGFYFFLTKKGAPDYKASSLFARHLQQINKCIFFFNIKNKLIRETTCMLVYAECVSDCSSHHKESVAHFSKGRQVWIRRRKKKDEHFDGQTKGWTLGGACDLWRCA